MLHKFITKCLQRNQVFTRNLLQLKISFDLIVRKYCKLVEYNVKISILYLIRLMFLYEIKKDHDLL